MATIFERVERLINAVYATPNPQVKTYFRDLRVTSTPPEEDDDSKYRYEPERNAETEPAAAAPKLPVRSESTVAVTR